jgi:hypothetical protein
VLKLYACALVALLSFTACGPAEAPPQAQGVRDSAPLEDPTPEPSPTVLPPTSTVPGQDDCRTQGCPEGEFCSELKPDVWMCFGFSSPFPDPCDPKDPKKEE